MEVKNGLSEEVHLSWLSNYEKGQSYEDMGERRRRAKDFGLLQEQKEAHCVWSMLVWREKVDSIQIIRYYFT